ncbi:MAG: hypothetical protein XD53_1098 [Petrotoga mobilis]|nr:MAG: hypothetical protein XD53_1098 [Petrotoga mobilis]
MVCCIVQSRSLNDFDVELGVFKGLALLQPYAKRFFLINYDFELGVFKGLAP